MTASPSLFLDHVLRLLRDELKPEQFDTWFRGFTLRQVEDDEIEFCVPNGFVRDWLNRNYLEAIADAAQQAMAEEDDSTTGSDRNHATGKRRKVRISLDPTLSVDEGPMGNAEARMPEVMEDMRQDTTRSAGHTGSSTQASTGIPQTLPRGGAPAAGDSNFRAGTPLNENYTFEQFVVGPSNQLAHAASLAVGQNPGRAYNPLFIHGNVGLGKTHLLQSISHEVRKSKPGATVVYLSCEEFTNRFIQAVQDKKLEPFREIYRSADVLVVDDVQFLAGKGKTQEEMFHTFNALYNAQKQIVFSSDRSPADIPTIQDRLVSRFKWGLVTDIQQPCFDTRLTIVRRKAMMQQQDLDDEVANFIAERVTTNIREVEGAVIKVLGVAAITDRPITLSLAEDALQGVAAPRPNQISIPDVISMITTEFSVSARDLTGKSRTQKVSLPRQIGMFLSREYTDHSLEEVGRYFGNRDHTTVLYAVQKIKKRSQTDRMFRELLTKLSNRLESGVGRTGS